MSEIARDELEGVIERLVDEYTAGDILEDWDLEELETQLRQIWPVGIEVGTLAPETVDREKLKDALDDDAMSAYDEREEAARRGADALPGALDPAAGDRQPLARTPLRHGLPARRHPPPRLRPDRPPRRLQKRGLQMFEELMHSIWDEFSKLVFRAEIEVDRGRSRRRHRRATQAVGGNGAGVVETVVKDEHEKVGRNDPCWCGSGKKYKRCHGA